MIKCIFKGDHGSGKTVALLRQAEALAMDGITPIFLLSCRLDEDILKNKAKQFNIDTSKLMFKTFNEFRDCRDELDHDSCRLMIDDVEAFVDILCSSGFDKYLVESAEYNTLEIDRKYWE